jgi:DNA polymerase (family 10)
MMLSKANLVDAVARSLVEELEPFTSRIAIAGSIRRRIKNPRDIDIVLIPRSSESWRKIVAFIDDIGELKRAGSSILGATVQGVHVDIWNTVPESWGAAMFFATGPKRYGISYRAKAKRNGMLLNQYGLYDLETGEKIAGKTEESIFKILRPRGYKKAWKRGK